jgi:hypothetical protein
MIEQTKNKVIVMTDRFSVNPTLCQLVAQTPVSSTHFIYEISQPYPAQCLSCAHYKEIKSARYCFRNDPSDAYRQKITDCLRTA